MSDWEAAYALLVVQITLLSVASGACYLVLARRHPPATKRVLAVTVLLVLGLTIVAVLPLPGSWSLHSFSAGIRAGEPGFALTSEPVSSDPNPVESEPIYSESEPTMPDSTGTSVPDNTPVDAASFGAGGPVLTLQSGVTHPWVLVLKSLLLIGGTIACIRLAWGLLGTCRFVRRSEIIDDDALRELADKIQRSIGCRPVEVRASTEIPSAATVGWRRPMVIVAADWRQWSEQELRAVLAHEMTHVRSNDCLMGLVARIMVALYFYHPLVRWLVTKLFLSQEIVADATAARLVGSRADYLAALSRIALRQDQRIKSLPVLAFGMLFHTSLMRRIDMLEIRDRRRSAVMRFVQGPTLVFLCLAAIAASALRLPAEDRDKTPDAEFLEQTEAESPISESAAPAEETALAALAAGGEAGPEKKSAIQPSDASLEGIWSVVSMRDDGRKLPSSTVVKLRFEFSDKKLKIRTEEQVLAETDYTAGATKEPATIDLTYEGQPTPGIYQLEGDALKICLGRSADKRPTVFGSGPNSPSRVLVILERGDLGPQGRHMFVVGVDGKGLHKLADFPKDLEMGSPDWSPDGKKITFDAWRLARGEEGPSALVYVVNVDGTGLEALGPGANPSWSPDSNRIAFARYGPRPGLWVMNADGSEAKLIDGQAWSCDWSPTANEIVTRVSGRPPNVRIIDPETGKWREVLKREEFQTVYWNLVWSPDGKWICFKGVRPDGTQEIVTVNAQGEDHGFNVLVSTKDEDIKGINPIVAWGGDPGVILVPLRVGDSKFWQIYLVDPKGEKPLKRLPGQHADVPCAEMAMSPDGKQVVYAARKAK